MVIYFYSLCYFSSWRSYLFFLGNEVYFYFICSFVRWGLFFNGYDFVWVIEWFFGVRYCGCKSG